MPNRLNRFFWEETPGDDAGLQPPRMDELDALPPLGRSAEDDWEGFWIDLGGEG